MNSSGNKLNVPAEAQHLRFGSKCLTTAVFDFRPTIVFTGQIQRRPDGKLNMCCTDKRKICYIHFTFRYRDFRFKKIK